MPIAIIGTEAIRRGWRIRPHKVRVRAGAPMRFPLMPEASPQVAGTATQRVWQRVTLQWEWLGGFVDRDDPSTEVVASHASQAA